MKLDAIDWDTITKKQAIALLNAAERKFTAFQLRYNRFEATDEEFSTHLYRIEDLEMFITVDLKPNDPRSLHNCYNGCVHGAKTSGWRERERRPLAQGAFREEVS